MIRNKIIVFLSISTLMFSSCEKNNQNTKVLNDIYGDYELTIGKNDTSFILSLHNDGKYRVKYNSQVLEGEYLYEQVDNIKGWNSYGYIKDDDKFPSHDKCHSYKLFLAFDYSYDAFPEVLKKFYTNHDNSFTAYNQDLFIHTYIDYDTYMEYSLYKNESVKQNSAYKDIQFLPIYYDEYSYINNPVFSFFINQQ